MKTTMIKVRVTHLQSDRVEIKLMDKKEIDCFQKTCNIIDEVCNYYLNPTESSLTFNDIKKKMEQKKRLYRILVSKGWNKQDLREKYYEILK